MGALPNPPREGLMAELARAAAVLTGASAAVAPASDPVAPRWTLRVTWTGAWRGLLYLGFDETSTRALAGLIMGLDEAPSDEAVADTVLELVRQAAGALSQTPEAAGAAFDVGMDADAVVVEADSYELTVGDLRVRVAGWGRLQPQARVDTPAAGHARAAAPEVPRNLDLILDLELPLTVRFGQTDVSLHTLVRLGPGSVVDLGRSPDDPVDLLVHGKVVARGEVVVVAGNYGVRITEVASAAERIRYIES